MLSKGYSIVSEKKIYKNAKWISALSPAIEDYINYTLTDAPSIEVLPNMADCQMFHYKSESFDSFDKATPFRVLYAGSLGFANGLISLIDCARKCQELNLPVSFTIMGDGAEKDSLYKAAQDLPIVVFKPHAGMIAVEQEMTAHHAVFISFRNEITLSTGCPNKFMDGLAAGKLIIINFEGWVKKTIEQHECGFSFQPESTDGFIEMLRPFLVSAELLRQYQENARQLAEAEFEVNVVMDRLLKKLRS